MQADRFAGYQQGLSDAGIPFDDGLVAEGDLTRAGGYQAALRLLELPQPPTAIIGANDLTAVGALRAAHERGLVVGRDLAIAGYDGIEDAEHSQPPLTTLPRADLRDRPPTGLSGNCPDRWQIRRRHVPNLNSRIDCS